MKKEAENKGRKRRTWVRLDCQGVLHGSINYLLELSEQAVFIKLIVMAEVYGPTPGVISDNDGKPLPREYIAHELHCSPETLEITLMKCKEENSIKENSNGIELVNFNKYQFTEYDRQRPYRDAKKDKIKNPDKYIQGEYGHMVRR